MNAITNTAPATSEPAEGPVPLTAEQLTQVAGGTLIGTGRYGCCNTCASVGLPGFAALAASLQV